MSNIFVWLGSFGTQLGSPRGPKRVDFLISWWWQQAGSRGSVCSLVNKLSENATCPSTGPATGHHQQQGDFPPKSVLGHVTWGCPLPCLVNNHEPRPATRLRLLPLTTADPAFTTSLHYTHIRVAKLYYIAPSGF